MLSIKRAYEPFDELDGYRILVDRLWPRGKKKEDEHLYYWAKEITPSDALRKSFGHKSGNFEWFKKEYIKELNENKNTKTFIKMVKELLEKGNVTLIYGAKNPTINHAIIVKEYIENHLAEM